MPGLAFPPVGRLGLTSPPSQVLCSATTATRPSRCPLLVARSPIPCSFLTFVSLLQARWRSGTLASTPGLLGLPVRLFRVADKETSGSPKFPGYPSVCMPRSSTPVVSSVLALSHSGLLPSTSLTASAFPLYNSRLSYCPRPYKFRGSITRPASSLPLASDARYRLRSVPAGFATSLLARLWLGGTYTHWVTATNFYRHTPISHRSGLLLARQCFVGWPCGGDSTLTR
jgi:hypothetical protein